MKRSAQPARVIPPGRIVKRELAARGWTQKDLARIIGRPASKISPLINGTKRITPDTAIELAQAFGTSPDLWVNMEASYRLRLAERIERKTAIPRRSKLYQTLPIAELIKRGWIPDATDIEELEASICRLLGIDTAKRIPHLAASFRGSNVKDANIPALVAWYHRAKAAAERQEASSFVLKEFKKNGIQEVLDLSSEASSVHCIPDILRKYGVRVVFLKHLAKTYLDGAVLAVEEQPAVVLTLRYDRIDSFWFTILHELAHIYAGHKGEFLDNLDNGESEHEEQEANALAAEWLVPADALDRFVSSQQPFFSRASIEGFASGIDRHPGIVLGRLHREDIIPYKNLRELLVKVSTSLDGMIEA